MDVKSFESGDEMLKYLEAEAKAANDAMLHVPDEIKNLQHGDYVVSERPDYGFVIFVEVMADDDELKDSLNRGYVFGRHYSVMCPDGELGSTHMSRLNKKITKEVFEKARKAQWDLLKTAFDE